MGGSGCAVGPHSGNLVIRVGGNGTRVGALNAARQHVHKALCVCQTKLPLVVMWQIIDFLQSYSIWGSCHINKICSV